MDILWLIGLFFGINYLCGSYSSAHISVLHIPKGRESHGPQYRFQYFVRDERGDYKTQEEAGVGGRARGSYAVEEPDGDLRIVQYTADIGGGFKAHIKVDHGGESASKLQEIDIPAEEMKKLIEKNRKKNIPEEPEVGGSSKSYLLGPPKKMSDIVMEQAAAIREIISKEIEAEEKREADEKLKNQQKIGDIPSDIKKRENIGDAKPPTVLRTEENKGGNFSNENLSEGRTAKGIKIEDKNTQSPVVRVALNPRNIDGLDLKDSQERFEPKYQEIKKEIQSPILGVGPVKNVGFKNKIMFYKPAEKKLNIQTSSKSLLNNGGNNSDDEGGNNEQEEIVLYSPYQNENDGNSQGDRKSKFIKVPYEVLKPYLTETQQEKDEEKSK